MEIYLRYRFYHKINLYQIKYKQYNIHIIKNK